MNKVESQIVKIPFNKRLDIVYDLKDEQQLSITFEAKIPFDDIEIGHKIKIGFLSSNGFFPPEHIARNNEVYNQAFKKIYNYLKKNHYI